MPGHGPAARAAGGVSRQLVSARRDHAAGPDAEGRDVALRRRREHAGEPRVVRRAAPAARSHRGPQSDRHGRADGRAPLRHLHRRSGAEADSRRAVRRPRAAARAARDVDRRSREVRDRFPAAAEGSRVPERGAARRRRARRGAGRRRRRRAGRGGERERHRRESRPGRSRHQAGALRRLRSRRVALGGLHDDGVHRRRLRVSRRRTRPRRRRRAAAAADAEREARSGGALRAGAEGAGQRAHQRAVLAPRGRGGTIHARSGCAVRAADAPDAVLRPGDARDARRRGSDQRPPDRASLRGQHLQRREAHRTARRAGALAPRVAADRHRARVGDSQRAGDADAGQTDRGAASRPRPAGDGLQAVPQPRQRRPVRRRPTRRPRTAKSASPS